MNRVREVRKAKRRPARWLADLIGVHDSTVTRIETGVFVPTPKQQAAIAAALQVPVDDLFDVVPCDRCGGTGQVPSDSDTWAA